MEKAPKDLKTRVEEWLEKGGYPLEMQVCQVFSSNGFDVIPSDFYLDTESGQSREIDLIASHSTDFGNFLVTFTYIVECKNNHDKPWVAFENTNFTPDHFTTYLNQPSNGFGKIILDIISKKYPFIFNNFLFPGNRIAYSIVSAFSSDNDNAYKGLYSVTKATAHRIKNGYYKGKPECEIFVPLIVISGKLFMGRLANGKIEISEQNNISAFWRNNVLDAPYSMILINTYENIDSLVEKAKKELDAVAHNLKEHQGFILEEINRKLTPANFFH